MAFHGLRSAGLHGAGFTPAAISVGTGTSLSTVVAVGIAASVGIASAHVTVVGPAVSRGVSSSSVTCTGISASVGASSASVTTAGKGGLSIGTSHPTVTTSGLSAAKGVARAGVSTQGLVARLGAASASFAATGLSASIGTSDSTVSVTGLQYLPRGVAQATVVVNGLAASVGRSQATVSTLGMPSGSAGTSSASVVATGLSASVGSSSASVATSSLIAASGVSTASVLASGLSASVGTSTFSVTSLGVAYIVETIPTVGGIGWTANTDTFAMSRYTNYAFNSLAMVDGYPVALGTLGAYILTGDDDAGTDISASITTDFNDKLDGRNGPQIVPELRRPRALYLARSGGQMNLTLRTSDSRGGDHSTDIALPGAGSDLSTSRTLLPRGLTYRYSSLTLANVEGDDFNVQQARMLVDLLRRRI